MFRWAWTPPWRACAQVSAVVCSHTQRIPSAQVGREHRGCTQTAPEITLDWEWKGMQALASGIIPGQGKLSFCVAKAICNADPTEGGKSLHTKQTGGSITGYPTPGNAPRSQRDLGHQGSQPGSPGPIPSHHVLSRDGSEWHRVAPGHAGLRGGI